MNKILSGIRPGRLKNQLHIFSQGSNLLQLLVIGVIFIILIIYIIAYPPSQYQWRFFGTVIALTALLILNIFSISPTPPEPSPEQAVKDWAFLAISAALVLVTVWLSGLFEMTYLLSMVCGQAGGRRGVWPAGVIFGAANMAAWLVLQFALQTPPTVILNVEMSLATGSIFVLLVVTLVKRYASQTQRAEKLLSELQAAQLRLEATHQQEKDLAIAEERIRLARDIHDGLGHHLIVLIVQLQAARELVERDRRTAADAIQLCQSEAQVALDEVRRSVSLMRQSPAESRPLPESLAALAREFGQHTGLQTSFETSGEALELSPFARETLYRAVQEGLTNAQKHARGAQHIAVCLSYEPQAVRLSVRDDGQASAQTAPDMGESSSGFGLQGLRERVSQLGGAFRCGPLPAGGFEVELCLPFESGSGKDESIPAGEERSA